MNFRLWSIFYRRSSSVKRTNDDRRPANADYNNFRNKKVLHFQGKFLSSRMESAMDFDEITSVYMGIDLRRRNIGMSEQFLDDAQIGAAFEQMRCKRMPEGMGGDPFFNLRSVCVLLNDIPDCHSRKRRTSLLI